MQTVNPSPLTLNAAEYWCKGDGMQHIPSIRREQQLPAVAQRRPEGSRRGGGGRAGEEAGGGCVQAGEEVKNVRRRGRVACPHEKERVSERLGRPVLHSPADCAPPTCACSAWANLGLPRPRCWAVSSRWRNPPHQPSLLKVYFTYWNIYY